MGMDSRFGKGSSIYEFFGPEAYKKNPDGSDAMHPDRHVLKITNEFVMSRPFD